mmetsp:Transcript_129627/g.224016  ORF Transcript_129627/g.224016 Transcript_129627/m.224016 type:complete len:233 (+) Transcript_129627:347-1045(+)
MEGDAEWESVAVRLQVRVGVAVTLRDPAVRLSVVVGTADADRVLLRLWVTVSVPLPDDVPTADAEQEEPVRVSEGAECETVHVTVVVEVGIGLALRVRVAELQLRVRVALTLLERDAVTVGDLDAVVVADRGVTLWLDEVDHVRVGLWVQLRVYDNVRERADGVRVCVRPVGVGEVELGVNVRVQLALDVRLGAVSEGERAALAVVEWVTESVSVVVGVTVSGTLLLRDPML